MRVICIRLISDRLGSPPKLGHVYTVVGRSICPCGTTWFQLGEIADPVFHPDCFCATCGRDARDLDGWWSANFAPVDDNSLGITEEEVRKLYEPSPKPIKERRLGFAEPYLPIHRKEKT